MIFTYLQYINNIKKPTCEVVRRFPDDKGFCKRTNTSDELHNNKDSCLTH